MFDLLLIVESHTAPKLSLGNDFTDVLEDELVRSQIGLGTEPIAFLFGLDDGDIGIFLSLESLILAVRATSAITHALYLGGAVDAVGIFPASSIFGDGGF